MINLLTYWYFVFGFILYQWELWINMAVFLVKNIVVVVCVCMCVYVLALVCAYVCMCVCTCAKVHMIMCLHVYGDHRSTSGMIPQKVPTLPFELGALTGTWGTCPGLADGPEIPRDLPFLTHSVLGSQVSTTRLVFLIGAEGQSQVLSLVQQALYQLILSTALYLLKYYFCRFTESPCLWHTVSCLS